MTVCEEIWETVGNIAKSAKPQNYINSGELLEKSLKMNSLPDFSLRETPCLMNMNNSTNNIPAVLSNVGLINSSDTSIQYPTALKSLEVSDQTSLSATDGTNRKTCLPSCCEHKYKSTKSA